MIKLGSVLSIVGEFSTTRQTKNLLEEASLVAIPFAAGDNDGAINKKQKNHCIILGAAAGIPRWRGQEEEPNRPWVVYTRCSKKRIAELILTVISNCVEAFTWVIDMSSI